MICREDIISALIKAQIPSPRLETDIILHHAAPTYPEITKKEENKIKAIINRRCNHEPLDKIIGQKEFYKSSFKVSSDVLSPRPDTEILVESALELLPSHKKFKILDLGTGSGCILLSILKERPDITGVGVDISKKALAIAKENAQSLGISKSAEFINQDWNDITWQQASFDMVISNPPYISKAEIETLDKEVKDYDPLIALDGGDDGLQCYRDIAKIAPKLLKDNGYILLEVGYNQANDVKNIFQNKSFNFINFRQDLSGINRCVVLKKVDRKL